MNKNPFFKISIYIIIMILTTNCENHKDNGLPIDGDGNTYDTVVIGTQTWLKQNLKTKKYYNGISIPLVTDNAEWASKKSAAFCWYNNDPRFKDDYGALYNWHVVNTQILCPVGYHVPTEDEWTTMINYLGDIMAGAKLKDNTPGFWNHYNDCASNETGFDARPAGIRNSTDGLFHSVKEQCYFWTSSLSSFEGNGRMVNLRDELCGPYIQSIDYKVGISIRCIKNK